MKLNWIVWISIFIISFPKLTWGQIKQEVYDADTRLAWYQQHLELRENSSFKSLKWKHIGPQLMGGRVTGIAKAPGRPFEFYVATASGGVWKTKNEGTTWQPIFDDAPSGSVGAIALDPSDPDVVWVGLGEANIFRSSMSGTGVYRSQDGGQTWKHLGLAETHHIARIIVDPTNSELAFVAASGREYSSNEERGIFRTKDGGETWEKVLYMNADTGAIDLIQHPNDPATLYAATWNRVRKPWSDPLPKKGNRIYKSTDGGDTWTPSDFGLPPEELRGRIGIAIAQSNPSVMYVLVDSHVVVRTAKEGEVDAYNRPRKDVKRGAVVYRSSDAGQNWVRVSSDNRNMQRLYSTYGWVFGQIRVDPSNENIVYALGVPLLKSTDGGATFKPLMSRTLHGDHHDLWIDPENSNYLINGNDGGVNLSYDGGETWKDLVNLPVVQFYNVAVDDAIPFNVYGSIQDNGSWSGPSNHRPGRDEEKNWQRVPGGEASIMQIDPENNDLFYSESFYGNLLRSTLSDRKTTRIVPQMADGEPTLRGQWLAPFQLSKHNSQIIYHGMQYVFRSMNRGESWEKISPDLTYNDPAKRGNVSFATITSLSESAKKFGLIYAGTDDGRLNVTKDSGGQWQEINGEWPKYKWVSRVVASAHRESVAYVTLNGKRDNDFQVYVYRTDDYGDHWQDIGDGIPGGPVNVICEDPFCSDVLYVGTDLGIYVSVNSGQSWSVLGSKLPITFVHDIAIQNRDKTMVIATHGRGMYTLDISDIPRATEVKP
ncbi:MAG: hypothetical protein AAGA30_07540 [Planctomycetota bacterium]